MESGQSTKNKINLDLTNFTLKPMWFAHQVFVCRYGRFLCPEIVYHIA